jgi:hypothetical protein
MFTDTPPRRNDTGSHVLLRQRHTRFKANLSGSFCAMWGNAGLPCAFVCLRWAKSQASLTIGGNPRTKCLVTVCAVPPLLFQQTLTNNLHSRRGSRTGLAYKGRISMKSVLLPLLAVAVLFGLTASVVAQTERVPKKDPKTNSNSNNSSKSAGSGSSSKSSGSSSSSSSSNSGNKGSSSAGSSSSGGSKSGNSGGSSGSSHTFHSPTLDALQNSQTGQANGKGAPSSSHEYDGAKKKKD